MERYSYNCFTGKWKPAEVKLDEVFRGIVLFLEAAMLEPQTQVCGAIVIFDMDGLTLAQTTKFTPTFAKRIVDWLQVRNVTFVFFKEYRFICNN